MRLLVLSEPALREMRRFRRRHSDLADRLDRVLRQMQDDVFHPSLRTHKLQGDLTQLWSSSINF